MTLRRVAVAVLATAALVGTTAACGSSSPSAGSKGTVSLSGQNFTEMQIMAQMYQQLLEHAGYTVNVKLVQTRDIYVKQLQSGKVDVVPEYVGALADYLNTSENGANAKPITAHGVSAAMSALKPLAGKIGVTMLQPAKATDQNAFAVTKKFAAAHGNLSTLSQLAALNQPIVLAAAPDCKGRPDCGGGLTKVYGLHITKILPLGYDSPQVKNSLQKGESQLGEVATTDGALASEGLVALADDKGIQPAQNLVPAVNSKFLKAHPDIATVLNKLSSTLTTADLAAMNTKVDVNRADPATVAKDYLTSKGLL